MSEDPGIHGVGEDVSKKQIRSFLTTNALDEKYSVKLYKGNTDLTYSLRAEPDRGSVVGRSSRGPSIHFGQVFEFPSGKRVVVEHADTDKEAEPSDALE